MKAVDLCTSCFKTKRRPINEIGFCDWQLTMEANRLAKVGRVKILKMAGFSLERTPVDVL
jgi:hypothetical protein